MQTEQHLNGHGHAAREEKKNIMYIRLLTTVYYRDLKLFSPFHFTVLLNKYAK